MESPKQECDNSEQRIRRHDFYIRSGFRDTNLYKKYDNLEMTIMILGNAVFTMEDWNNIVAELRKFWTWD